MEALKTIMGSAYKEGITVEEINEFLSKGNFVNLKDGKYVDKDKYEKAVNEKNEAVSQLKDLKENTKDYETIKAENETYKTEKADSALNERLKKLGVSESSLKYVKGDIKDGSLKLDDDDSKNGDAMKSYFEKNPQFQEKTAPTKKVVSIKTTDKKTEGNGGNEDAQKARNENINQGFRDFVGIEAK